MNAPDVDTELERLFAAGREATLPARDAKERIRAGLNARLAAGPASASLLHQKAWLAVGAVLVAVGAAGVWLSATTTAKAPAASSSVAVVHLSAVSPPPSPPTAPMPALDRAPAAGSASAPPLQPAKPPAPTKRSSSAPPGASGGSEISLVRSIQQALRAGDPAQALALTHEHAERFPRGTLVEERESARAVARCQLAEPARRPAILEAFAKTWGASPYAARVRGACR